MNFGFRISDFGFSSHPPAVPTGELEWGKNDGNSDFGIFSRQPGNLEEGCVANPKSEIRNPKYEIGGRR